MPAPTAIVAYLALFSLAGISFLFVNLLVGRLLRPKAPNAEKLEVYECGEPTIGSSFVQFDLRFYVVALLFIIFDVEIAFFFPWAAVYGKATQLMDPNLATVEASADPGGPPVLSADAQTLYREMGVVRPAIAAPATGVAAGDAVERASNEVTSSARRLALISIADIGVFFAVLMVGFAYVWRRGDLDWVRAVTREPAEPDRPLPLREEEPLVV